MAKRPVVIERIAQLRAAASRIVFLSIQERLGIASEIAINKKLRPFERIKASQHYTELAGDAAPERLEIAGPGGTPLQAEIGPMLSVRERIERIKRARGIRE